MCKKLVFLSVALLVAASATANAASIGPVGWWKFDETSGTTAVDSAGGRNGVQLPATADPPVAWVPGQLGNAIQFGRAAGAAGNADANPYMELPISDLLGKLSDATISLWVQWDGSTTGGWQRILDFGAGTTVYMFLTSNAGGSATSAVRYAIRNVATGEQTVSSSGNPINDKGWHHIAVGINKTTMRNWLYIDGIAVRDAATALLPKDLALPAPNADGTQQGWQIWVAKSQYASDSRYSGKIDDLRIYDRFLSADDVTSVMNGGIGYGVANTPSPANKATEILAKGTVLSFAPGATAVKHDVYFGKDKAALKNVLKGTTATTYAPGTLDFATTYYWRVDECDVNGVVTVPGNVWSFTTELLAYKITAVTPSASSQTTGSEVTKTTDSSGLASDLHGTDQKTMWVSTPDQAAPVWVQYDFDKIYKMYEMWVWNANTEYELDMGYGVKDVTVEYSVDGKAWTKLGDFTLAQGPAAEGYAHDTPIAFNGVAAKNVKITAKNNWGDAPKFSLSEVRFYYTPSYASVPSPANNATGQRPDVTLTCAPARTATQHKVFFSTDQAAVTKGTVVPENVLTNSFSPADLQLDAVAYYWRVDEVNPAEKAKPIWPGDVWKFTTATYMTVDDMEGYSDDLEGGKAIYQTWIDGYTSSKNGSQVGYRTAPFADKATLHAGNQAMPFFYTNTKSEPISEATRTFATAQNWSLGGATTLTLFFRPDVNNVGGQLYVKVNGVKFVFKGSLESKTAAPLWKQWNISLVDVVDLAGGINDVKSMSIGVDGISKGLLLIDDIRLYKTPIDCMPRDPGTKNLVSYINMEGGKVADSISGVTAVNLNATTFVDSAPGFGKALKCDGGTTALTTQFVDIGPEYWDKVVSKLSNCTFSVWTNYTGVGSIWQRVFDFGCGTNVNCYISSSGATMGVPQFAVKTNVANAGSTGTGYVETLVRGAKMSIGWHHLAGVVDNSGAYPTISIYVDGSLSGARSPADCRRT